MKSEVWNTGRDNFKYLFLNAWPVDGFLRVRDLDGDVNKAFRKRGQDTYELNVLKEANGVIIDLTDEYPSLNETVIVLELLSRHEC